MKKTLISLAVLSICAIAQAAPVVIARPAPVAARPAPAAAARPIAAAPVTKAAPAKPTETHSTPVTVANPVLFTSGSKKSCDDRAAAKGDCNR